MTIGSHRSLRRAWPILAWPILAWPILACLTATVTLLAPGAARSQPRPNHEYCAPAGTAWIVLIDVTTPYDPTDKTAISALIQRTLSGARGGDRILIRTIGDSFTHSERLIERCIPFCKEEGLRWLTCNDGLIRIDRDRIRTDTVDVLGQRLAHFTELRFSDIIRTINRSAQEDFGTTEHVQLIVYSDLIENSDYLTSRSFFHYKTGFLIDGLRKLGFIPNLRGAAAHVAGVGRSDAADRRPLGLKEMAKVTEFWKAYFAAANAGAVYIGQSLPVR